MAEKTTINNALDKVIDTKKSLSRRDFSSGNYVIPDYVYAEHVSKRHQIFSSLPLSQDMINIFNELCIFIIHSGEKAVIQVAAFLDYVDGKNKFRRESALSLLLQLAEIITDDDIQLMEILDEDDEGNPRSIILKEKRDIDLKLFMQLEKYLETAYQKVDGKKVALPDSKNIADDLKCNTDSVTDLCISIPIEKLTLKKLLTASTNKKFVGVLIPLSAGLKDIVVPSGIMSKFVYILVEMIHSYYENNENQNFNKALERKLKEQSLEISRIQDVLTNVRIQDKDFLNFSQTFYSVMMDLHQTLGSAKKSNKNTIMRNNLIAAIILSKLSFNRREEIRLQQHHEAEKKNHFESILYFILTNSINTKYKEKVFYPSNLDEIKSQQIISNKKGMDLRNLELKLTFGSKYNDSEILNFIKGLNEGTNTINEICLFENHNQVFYVHRCRLITTFFSLLDNERNRITTIIKKKWAQNYKLILRNNQEEEFYLLVEENISSFFSDFHKMIVQLLLLPNPSDHAKSKNEYLMNRLFFNEKEKLKFEKVVPDLMISEDSKKRKILKLLLETFFTKDNKVRKKYDILQISFPFLVKEAIEKSNMGIVSKMIFYFTGFWDEVFSMLSLKNAAGYFNKVKNSGIDLISSNSSQLLSRSKNDYVMGKFQIPVDSNPKEKTPGKLRKNTSTVSPVVDKQKNDLKTLKENIPVIESMKKIQAILDQELDIWNLKIGEARDQQTEYINDVAFNIYQKFDVAQLKEDQIDSLLDTIIKNNKSLEEISENCDKDSLKKYLFYLIARLKYQEITKKS